MRELKNLVANAAAGDCFTFLCEFFSFCPRPSVDSPHHRRQTSDIPISSHQGTLIEKIFLMTVRVLLLPSP